MVLKAADVDARIERACSRFLENERDLLDIDINERALTFRLATYIQVEFPDWQADCEYNRDDDMPKRLSFGQARVSVGSTEARTVYPDIIVHKRRTTENLIVIEAKKSTTSHTGEDMEKLEAYVSQYGYLHAYAIEIPVGKDVTDSKAPVRIKVERVR